ncbi:5821_t:CDS:10 [Acaulospora colombiana]|uniref:5821_t:CDS:1 n=1 Tax=Acaulospora colombiana TaxID=27376 RepID=A0ACA9M3H7_9GLOM|nr:5821_t:CDS:10 [Acaulospora colombiana]
MAAADHSRNLAKTGLSDYQIRDLNDEINKLMREKGHWEDQIKKLGGPDYRRIGPKMMDHEGKEVPGNRGYKYFGRAKDLPGVRELFEQDVPTPQKRTRFDLYKNVDADYYGYRDEEDGSLLEYEVDRERSLIEETLRFSDKALPKDKSTQKKKEGASQVEGEITDIHQLSEKYVAHVAVPSQKEVEEYLSYSSGAYSNNPSQGFSYGAGGFVASGEGSTSRRDSDGRPSDRSAKTVRSVTIRQLLSCDASHSDGEQMLDGKPLNLVTFVAKVHNISPKNNLIDITVEDGSGFIEVKLFSNNNDNLSEEQDQGNRQSASTITGSAYDSSQVNRNNNTEMFASRLHKEVVDLVNKNAVSEVGMKIDDICRALAFQYGSDINASYGVEDAEYAVAQLAQTTMRAEIGQMTLDRTLAERSHLNANIVDAINSAAAEAWGIRCLRYEIRDIHPPAKVVESMHSQVSAERSKRASILESEGARQAAINVAEGAKQSVILASEAQKAEQINKASGEAEAILLRAKATAEGIRQIADAIEESPRGTDAVTLTVAEKYVEAFGQLAKQGNTIIVPASTNDASSMIAQALSIYQTVSKQQLIASPDTS